VEVVRLAATLLVLLGGAIMAVGTVLATRVCLRALLRRAQRRRWDDLVARHRELDRELDRIWQRW
jgi:hypothetical protein